MESLALEIDAELQLVGAQQVKGRQKQVGDPLLAVEVPVHVREVIAAVAERRDLESWLPCGSCRKCRGYRRTPSPASAPPVKYIWSRSVLM